VALNPKQLEEWKRLAEGAAGNAAPLDDFAFIALKAIPVLIAEVERLARERSEAELAAATNARGAANAAAQRDDMHAEDERLRERYALEREAWSREREQLLDPIVRKKMMEPPGPIVLQGDAAETFRLRAEVERLRAEVERLQRAPAS